ncbi:hypothetical protein ACIBQ6_34885 [Nonomuraea sp. NPDC049655]|uniref:hypothetical protein n=1 Tax=Nonomuraea sp. NPDC049655 TaxID=3364355 RepID=UPI00379436A7
MIVVQEFRDAEEPREKGTSMTRTQSAGWRRRGPALKSINTSCFRQSELDRHADIAAEWRTW